MTPSTLLSKSVSSVQYYNRVTIVAKLVILISWIILIIKNHHRTIITKNFKPNNLAYLDYDRSYDRDTVIVLATDLNL